MEENLNLIEKLKNVPAGTMFYSTTRGDCEFCRIDGKSIIVKIDDYYIYIYELDKFGRLGEDGECILFPSKDQRDWSKFEYDPIKIGTPVMVRDNKWEAWRLKYYNGNGECCGQTYKDHSYKWREIIPVSEFDFENLCRKGEAK